MTDRVNPIRPQPTSIDITSINDLPFELLKCILFMTGEESNTGLVNRLWNVQTLAFYVEPHRGELLEFLKLLVKNLEKHPEYVEKFKTISNELLNLPFLVTPAQAKRFFLTRQGSIVGVLKKLPREERNSVLKTIGHQIPDSMCNLFRLTNLTLTDAVNTGDFDTFYIVFRSLPKFELPDFGAIVVKLMAEKGYHQMLQTFLANVVGNGDIDEAVLSAVKHNHRECFELLLHYGSISISYRGEAVRYAARNNNLLILCRLLDSGPIEGNCRGVAVVEAIKNYNFNIDHLLDIVHLLLGNGPVLIYYRIGALNAARRHHNPQLEQLLQSPHPNSADDQGLRFRWQLFSGFKSPFS